MPEADLDLISRFANLTSILKISNPIKPEKRKRKVFEILEQSIFHKHSEHVNNSEAFQKNRNI